MFLLQSTVTYPSAAVSSHLASSTAYGKLPTQLTSTLSPDNKQAMHLLTVCSGMTKQDLGALVSGSSEVHLASSSAQSLRTMPSLVLASANQLQANDLQRQIDKLHSISAELQPGTGATERPNLRVVIPSSQVTGS